MDIGNTNSEKAKWISDVLFAGAVKADSIEEALDECEDLDQYEVIGYVLENFPVLSERGIGTMATAIYMA